MIFKLPMLHGTYGERNNLTRRPPRSAVNMKGHDKYKEKEEMKPWKVHVNAS